MLTIERDDKDESLGFEAREEAMGKVLILKTLFSAVSLIPFYG